VCDATELASLDNDGVRRYWPVIVTRMTGAGCIHRLHRSSRPKSPARRQCHRGPEEVYKQSAPATLHQVEHFRFTQFLLPNKQALPSLRTAHLPITSISTCGE
jgi:hypothetical protein